MNEHLKKKVRSQISQAELGRRMGLPQQVISRWMNGHQIPANRVIQLCDLMNWGVTPHELRPDIYPNSTDGLPLPPDVDNDLPPDQQDSSSAA